MIKPTTFLASYLTLGMFAGTASAALIAFEFNTAGDTEGWTASAAPPNAAVTNFGQAVSIDTTTGVLTSGDIGIDPQVLYGSIALPAGDTWSSVSIRFRHLSDNPGAAGVTSTAYDTNGTIIFFNGNTQNLGVGPVTTKTVNGVGGFTGDVYGMTVVSEADDWQVMTLDLTAAPTLNSSDLTGVRFDPVGNAAGKNFEIDYARFTSVPEPSLPSLLIISGTVALMRRRR